MTEPTAGQPAPLDLDEDGAGWLQLYNDTRDKIADLQPVLKMAEGRLREIAGEAQTVRWQGETVISYPRYERTTVDLARLRQDHPALVAQYEVTRPAHSFTVRRPV